MGLLETRLRHTFRLGDTDVGVAAGRFSTSNRMNALATASFELDWLLLPPAPVDYAGPLEVRVARGGTSSPLFTGDVLAARVAGDRIEGDARSGSTLDERVVPPMVTRDVPAVELIHLMTRLSGFEEEDLRIEELDELPTEVFEVVVPIQGVRVTRQRRIGGVWLVDPSRGRAFSDGFAEHLSTEQFARGDAYGLALVTASRLFDAEAQGLHAIQVALGWLTTRSRYATALLPSGKPKTYRREEARAVPQML